MKKYLIFVIIVFVLGNLSAEVSLSLSQSVELAIQNNKELQTAREEVGKYKEEYKNVRGNLLPQLNFSAGYQYKKTQYPDSALPEVTLLSTMLDTTATANDQMIAGYIDSAFEGLYPSAEEKENSAFGQLKLDQVIFMGGKLINGINIASKLYHLQEKNYFLTEQNIIFQTKDMYYQTKLAEEVVEIQKDALEFARKYQEQVSHLFEQGLVSEYDLLRAELEVKKLEPQLMEAEKNFELAKQSFMDHLNLQEEIKLTEEIELQAMDKIELDNALNEALNQRIELELSDLNVAVNHVQLRYEKGNFLPNIGISAEYNYFGQNQNQIESEDWGNYYQVGIGFSMPLFTGFSNSAKIAKARHSLKQAKLSDQDMKEKIQLEVRNSFRQWQTNLEKVKTQRENIELAEKGMTIAEARYNNQVSNQLEVLDAQLQLKSARLNYLNAVYQAMISYEQMKKVLGREL